MERIYGNNDRRVCCVRKIVGWRWNSIVGCDNNRFRGIFEYLDEDERREE